MKKNSIKANKTKEPIKTKGLLPINNKLSPLIVGGVLLGAYHLKRAIMKHPFKKQNGLYKRIFYNTKNNKNIIMLTYKQAKEINNLLIAKKAINEEIKRIKKYK